MRLAAGSPSRSELSGGERFRAVLAAVLHTDPRPQLLLLDEPTNDAELRHGCEGA